MTHRIQTDCIHAGQSPEPTTGAVMTPIFAVSTFAQDGPGEHRGYEYSRSGNPTRAALESCLATLEKGTQAYAMASGLAAETTVLDILPKDSHLIASDDLYGGTYRLFEGVKSRASGLSVSFVDANDADQLIQAIRPETRMIWIETPSNPLLKIIDLSVIAEIGRERGLLTVCDNTFATPVAQRPIEHGFDIVVHSLTKYINGHSDIIGGAIVVGDNEELAEQVEYLQNATGAILSPFDSFLVLRGIKTLPLRMRAHSENALAIASFLEGHAKVEQVIYPGLPSHPQHELALRQMDCYGGMLSFVIRGSTAEARRFIEGCRLFTLAESLGGVESLVELPAIMTHASIPAEERERIGIRDSLIRLSVGVEDADDLIFDIDNALATM